MAGLDLNQIADPGRTEVLIAKLEGAENELTKKVLQYWSQNQHLRMKFDIRPAQPGDPYHMRSGMNIWGRVSDTKHNVTTALGTRSRGFIWFFSFLAWYSKIRKENKDLILLLDEPGIISSRESSRRSSSLFRKRAQARSSSYLYYSFAIYG